MLAAFAGLLSENPTRSHGWRFLDIGRRLERALQMLELLRVGVARAAYPDDACLETLLQVADNLSRALLAAPADQRAANDTLKNLATGVELTERELVSVLENQGVKKISALNQPFDANFHNAIQEVDNKDVPTGTVVQVFQEGYMIHDRLLRPAMVVVSKGGPKREGGYGTMNGSGGVNATV